ncbi:TYDP2 phosphodiesterase, partial [Nothoprocta pentlandii]|nr:TYDP2 phosphodiesterase [Nothoprocta pentlandii]
EEAAVRESGPEPSPPPRGRGQEGEEEEEEAAGARAAGRAKRRRGLCSQFAAITGSGEEAARRCLAEHGWELQVRAAPGTGTGRQRDGNGNGNGNGPRHGAAVVDLTTDATTSNTGVNGTAPEQQEDDSSFSLLTWNIDGLDLGNQQDRARGVCSYLALYSPDVVFLQEVIPPYLCYLQKRAGNYTIIPGNIDGYFTAVMLKNSRVKLVKQEIVPFPTTSMMRNLLVVHVNVAGNELCLMTSHLESTKDHSKERIKQLQTVFKNMQKESESTTVIFGGDTNLRDSEVNKLGGLPDSIVDVWEFLGKPKHCRYTWDTSCNSNLAATYTCKLRFDRVYLRPAPRGAQLLPRSMDLIGLEKLDCGRFPSDHWGVLCHFDVIL